MASSSACLTVDGCQLPVMPDCGVAAQGEVQTSAVLRPVAVPRGQDQSLILPARRAQVLPGIVANQHGAVVVHVQDLDGNQGGRR